MRKALLTVLLVSVIVFVSISFMGASCTINPGPGPALYTLTVTNQSNIPLTLKIFDDSFFNSLVRQVGVGTVWPNNEGNIVGESGYYLRVQNANTLNYLEYSPGVTWWRITGSQSFVVTTAGGWVIEER